MAEQKKLDLDPAANLPITIPALHSYIISIKIKDKVTQVYQQFTGVWKMVIARDAYGNEIIKTFTAGSGFNISVDLLTLTIDVPTVLNLIKPGRYFYDLRGDVDGYSKHPLEGEFIVNSVVAKP